MLIISSTKLYGPHKMPKISFLIAITLTALLGLSACNTVQGVGKDIQSIGKTTEEAAD